MSDYLNNIVARSLNLAEVVQPRVPQLFEQTVPRPDPALQTETQPGTPGSSEVSKMSVSRMAPAESAAPPPRFEAAKLPSEATPLRAENSERFSVSPTPTFAPLEKSLPSATVHPRGIKVDATEVAKPAAQSRSALQPTESAPSVTPAAQPSSTIVSMSAVELPATTSAAIRPTGVPHPTLSSLPHNHAEQSAPAIRITIGRVDVRAIMPAAPTPARTHNRPGPALSLESYLKQREEGKR